MQFAKYLFKIANLHLITGEKAIPIYIIARAWGLRAGVGWFWRFAGEGRPRQREYAPIGKFFGREGGRFLTFYYLCGTRGTTELRSTAQLAPQAQHRDCTGTAQGGKMASA